MGNKFRYRTPGPGTYDVREASRQCLKKAPAAAFAGCLNRIDRLKTGPLKIVREKSFVPGPCSYATPEAEFQPKTYIFGKADREDISKLFFGNKAVAYIKSRTPGPGTYELRWHHPCSLYPTRDPGPTIAGPLANVNRLQTGPLGPVYRSCTPGPGAYICDGISDSATNVAPWTPRLLRHPRRKSVSPSVYRTANTTFGIGTREQAGQVLAPGFKGCVTRSTRQNPGPGAYPNVPGSLGDQVVSTLQTSATTRFSQRDRLKTNYGNGIPGPGAYTSISSLGSQVSSTCTTAPMPKFGTSVRRALEDGLVG